MSNKISSMSFAKTLAFSLLSIPSCMHVLALFKYTLVGVISAQGLVSGVSLCSYPSNQGPEELKIDLLGTKWLKNWIV
jgi:hypothetical protein